jgi:hypothetical protein
VAPRAKSPLAQYGPFQKLMMVITAAGIIAIVLYVVSGIAHILNRPPPPPPPAPVMDYDPIVRTYAEGQVKTILKDPESATFSNEVIKNAKLPIVCGEVNARNSFGGMTGATPFIVLGASAQIDEGPHQASFRRMWNQVCAGDGTTPSPKRKHRHATASE